MAWFTGVYRAGNQNKSHKDPLVFFSGEQLEGLYFTRSRLPHPHRVCILVGLF